MTEPVEADGHSQNVSSESAPAPEEKPIEKKIEPVDVQTSLGTPIKITLTRKQDDTEQVVVEKISLRNLFVLLATLDKLLFDQPGLDTLTIKLTTEGVTKEGQTAVITMAQGPAKFVVESVKKQMIPSKAAASIVFSTIRDLLELTPMRAAMVTMVYEEQKPAAFAVINQTLGDTLLPEDINMLVYHAQNNIDMFRDKMRKAGHVFPDDNPIIMPGMPKGGLIVPR